MSQRPQISSSTSQDGSGSARTTPTLNNSMDHGQEPQPHPAGQANQPAQPPVVSSTGNQPPHGEHAGTLQVAIPSAVSQNHPPLAGPSQASTTPGQPPPILIPPTLSQSRPRSENGQSSSPMMMSGQTIVSPRPTQMTQIERLEAEKLEEPSPSRRGSTPGHGPDQSQSYQQHPQMPRHPPRASTDPTLTRVGSRRSAIDWIVPVDERKDRDLPPRPKTLGERLTPTLTHAKLECEKYALRAKMTGYALNIAIGMQVLLGALTTAVSAATSGRSTSIATSVLGGLATLVASYLARARGSNEPELSVARVKDLEQFERECNAFIMDHGHLIDDSGPLADRLRMLRTRFEDLLGNSNGERRLAPPG